MQHGSPQTGWRHWPITVLGGQGLDWQKIRFPDDKVSQEAKITSLFVQAIYRSDGTKFETTSLPEADHDARLTLGETEIDLQLTEIVIPSKKKSPYRSEKRHYDAGYFADQIISQIQRKNMHRVLEPFGCFYTPHIGPWFPSRRSNFYSTSISSNMPHRMRVYSSCICSRRHTAS